MTFTKQKLFIVGLVILTLITVPLTVFLSRQQQDDRSSAAASTTLYYNPTTTASTPLSKTVGDIFTVDVMVNPGTNKVSTVRYQIYFDPTKIVFEGTSPVTINSIAFPANLEGPIIQSDRVAGTVSIGANYDLALLAPTKIATLRFKAVGQTGTGTTTINYTALSQVLSVGETEQATENVLSGTTPFHVKISILPTPTPTKIPPTPTPTPAPPTLTFSAGSTSLPYNGSTTLSWNSSNTTSCTASNGWTGTKDTSSSQNTGVLTSTITYTLTCTGPGGSISRTVTITVGPGPTATPTKVPTPTPTTVPPTSTPTPIPNSTTLNLTVFMHGLGNSGDNANPTANSLSNKNPLRKSRSVEVEVYNANDVLVAKNSGTVNYTSTTGNFVGSVNMGSTITTGVYTIKVKSPFYLKRRVSGIQTITAGTTNNVPAITIVTGDSNNDNALNILDYNMIIGCYSDFGPALSCTPAQKLATDLTDDGNVNQFDYNLFLRDLSVQNGD